MNRHERKSTGSVLKKAAPDHDADKMMQVLVMRMAEKGPEIVKELRAMVGGDYTPGHALDVLLKAAAAMEATVMANDGAAFVEYAAHVLFLARDVAISQGVIKVGPAPTAEKPS